MSIHKSLAVASSLTRQRNVFSRFERLTALEKDGKWSPGQSVYGLPKVKTRVKLRKVKKEKKVDDAAAATPAAGAAAAPAAKPAAKAKK